MPEQPREFLPTFKFTNTELEIIASALGTMFRCPEIVSNLVLWIQYSVHYQAVVPDTGLTRELYFSLSLSISKLYTMAVCPA